MLVKLAFLIQIHLLTNKKCHDFKNFFLQTQASCHVVAYIHYYAWKPSTAVCGIKFYQGEGFAKWKNNLLVAALKFEEVRLLDIEADRVMHQEVFFKNYGRVGDIGLDPEGNM